MIGNYSYQGCFNDSTSARALKSTELYGTSSNNMTHEKCLAFCSSYTYFGLEYGQECYCGNSLSNNSQNQTGACGAASCNMPCAGTANETCGAGSRLTLYYFNGTVAGKMLRRIRG